MGPKQTHVPLRFPVGPGIFERHAGRRSCPPPTLLLSLCSFRAARRGTPLSTSSSLLPPIPPLLIPHPRDAQSKVNSAT
jgi:hypothetical protein